MTGRRLVATTAVAVLGVLSCSRDAIAPIGDAPAAERNALFLQAIRDAGYLCDVVLEADAADGIDNVWRVVCNDMLAYVASLESDEAIHIEPVPYVDPRVPIRGGRLDFEAPRPDP